MHWPVNHSEDSSSSRSAKTTSIRKALWHNGDFTITSHCDYVIVYMTLRDVDVKSMGRECEIVMTVLRLSATTHFNHFVKSSCDFSVEICDIPGD